MNISIDELKELIDSKNSDYILVDVRRPEEVKLHGAIPTSINIPLNELSSKINELDIKINHLNGKKDTKIIFYCRTGGRSTIATEFALSKGFNAVNFKGSVQEWSKIDKDVEMY